jgi:hypothetical protein
MLDQLARDASMTAEVAKVDVIHLRLPLLYWLMSAHEYYNYEAYKRVHSTKNCAVTNESCANLFL